MENKTYTREQAKDLLAFAINQIQQENKANLDNLDVKQVVWKNDDGTSELVNAIKYDDLMRIFASGLII